MEIEDVPTPALVLNVDALERNLLRMAEDYEQLGRSAVQRSEKRRFG